MRSRGGPTGVPGTFAVARSSHRERCEAHPTGCPELHRVSAGGFAGARVIQGLLPVVRELGLATIFWDVNIGSVGKVFTEDGRLLDEAVVRRSDRFIRELIWMAKVLRYGREHVNVDEEAAERLPPVKCANCGTVMTHHADKEVTSVPPLEEVTVVAALACSNCGAQQAMVTSVTG